MRAMAARGQELVLQELGLYLSDLETQPKVRELDGQELLGQAIRILVRGFASGKGFSQSLIRLCWTLEKPDETASAVRLVSERLAMFFERIQHPQLQRPSTAQLDAGPPHHSGPNRNAQVRCAADHGTGHTCCVGRHGSALWSIAAHHFHGCGHRTSATGFPGLPHGGLCLATGYAHLPGTLQRPEIPTLV